MDQNSESGAEGVKYEIRTSDSLFQYDSDTTQTYETF